jgi:hypothetical protein
MGEIGPACRLGPAAGSDAGRRSFGCCLRRLHRPSRGQTRSDVLALLASTWLPKDIDTDSASSAEYSALELPKRLRQHEPAGSVPSPGGWSAGACLLVAFLDLAVKRRCSCLWRVWCSGRSFEIGEFADVVKVTFTSSTPRARAPSRLAGALHDLGGGFGVYFRTGRRRSIGEHRSRLLPQSLGIYGAGGWQEADDYASVE